MEINWSAINYFERVPEPSVDQINSRLNLNPFAHQFLFTGQVLFNSYSRSHETKQSQLIRGDFIWIWRNGRTTILVQITN